jgi:preprotein translocase subunit SecA
LIISGQASDSSDLYSRINSIIPQLTRVESEDGPGDYSVDEKSKQAFLTESGHDTAERLMVAAGLLSEGESLYDAANIALVHHLTAGLRAHAIYNRDVDYIVQDGTRRSRPRKASASSTKIRLSPRLPFRTTSGFTTSSPA